MKIIFLLSLFLCGCGSIPIEPNFNGFRLQKDVKLVLGKKIEAEPIQEKDKLKLNLNRSPSIVWKRVF